MAKNKDAIDRIRCPRGFKMNEVFWGTEFPEPVDFSQGPWWFKDFEEMFDCLTRWNVNRWVCRYVPEGYLEVEVEEGFYGY